MEGVRYSIIANKISLIGRAGVGKTSMIKLVFEGYDPKDLMIKPLEPTKGINPKSFDMYRQSIICNQKIFISNIHI